jgi:exonuclease III
MKKFTVWYQNIRGIKSKMESLTEKIEEHEPTVFCITETHLGDKEPFEMEGYKIYRNDRDREGGGTIIAVNEAIQNICTIVEKDNTVGETTWLVIDNGKVKIRVGVVYAPQESRTKKDVYKKLYKRVENQLDLARERGQKMLLLGDFNCKIGEWIEGNKPKVSKSGKLLQKMVTKQKLVVVNSMDICSGRWTRVEGESRSIIFFDVTRKKEYVLNQ